jgi:hypothetical protein
MTAFRTLTLISAVAAAGVGAFLGTSRIADASPTTSARVVSLRSRDVAVFGGVQCIANIEAGQRHLLCQRRPRRTARYEVAVYPRNIVVFKMGYPDDPVYVTPRR